MLLLLLLLAQELTAAVIAAARRRQKTGRAVLSGARQGSHRELSKAGPGRKSGFAAEGFHDGEGGEEL
jgi:hypothetical protein